MSASPTPLLEVRDLTKRYGAMVAVDRLSFSVAEGEVVGISGPNGAGKTTLFDVVSGLTPVSEGQVLLRGEDVTGASAERMCHLGLARTFQLNAVFDSMSVQDNLLTSAYFAGRRRLVPGLGFDRAARERVEEVMDVVGITDLRHETASRLPILERKLLMLASAIAGYPRLLLLDEPVGGLNAGEIQRCAEILQRIRHFHGITIVLIEHVMSFVTAIAERVVILHHGAKLYEGSVRGMSEDAEVVSVYLGPSGREALRARQGSAS